MKFRKLVPQTGINLQVRLLVRLVPGENNIGVVSMTSDPVADIDLSNNIIFNPVAAISVLDGWYIVSLKDVYGTVVEDNFQPLTEADIMMLDGGPFEPEPVKPVKAVRYYIFDGQMGPLTVCHDCGLPLDDHPCFRFANTYMCLNCQPF